MCDSSYVIEKKHDFHDFQNLILIIKNNLAVGEIFQSI